jgi:putative ABC transport system permease protein
MGTFLHDFRYGVRTLVQNPGFALVTIVCLALGIGVNSTIFSVVDTVAIRALPFTNPDELVALHTTRKSQGIERGNVAYPEMRDWKERSRSFADMASVNGRSLTLSDGDEPERFVGATVTANLFPMLGIQPMLGRQFRPEEDRPGGPPVVLLSHGVWQRRYASDRTIVGRTIMVNGNPHTVVGVMPPRFQFPERAQLWIPQTPIEYTSARAARNLVVFARLKPGVSVAEASRDIASVADGLAATERDDQGWSATAITMRAELMDSEVQLIVFTMMGAVTLVLLIACANVANLLLARATVRQREIAVRSALGAGRGRIVRQLLTESLLIALASAPLGVAIAYFGLQWLTSAIPPQKQAPYYIDWSMSPRIVVYTAVVAIVTGLLFGLAPALQAARTNLQECLKDGGRGSGGSVHRNRFRSALVVLEIALSLVLLVGASLFVRSFLNLQAARAGIDTSPLMLQRFYMPGDAYNADDAMSRRVDDIVRRTEALPGVAAAFASNMMPLDGGGADSSVVSEGASFKPGDEPHTLFFAVTPHLLKALNQRVVAGRDLTDADGASRTPVALVNGVLARRLWPNLSDVVGQRIRLLTGKDEPWLTVVGVVSDFRLFTVQSGKPSPYVFVSYPHSPARNTGHTVRVAGGAPAAIASAIREQIRASDVTLPIFNAQTGEDARLSSFWEFRLFSWMFSIFGVIALALASIGVYGVLSYSVSQRTQEIGVRMALGATRQRVFALVVRHGAGLAALGVALGILGAAGVTRVVKSLLYNVGATDPISFAGTALLLALVALAASYIPARRATAVDPIDALRSE